MLGCAMYLDAMVDSALVLCNLHNRSVALTQKNSKNVSGAQVCSNSFPGLLLPPKKFDMALILQVDFYIYHTYPYLLYTHHTKQTISRQRCEMCCLSLISCLLASCKPDMGASSDDSSDTSSVEILKALTVHLASPATQRPKSATHQRPGRDASAANKSPNIGSPFGAAVVGPSNGIAKPELLTIDTENNVKTGHILHTIANQLYVVFAGPDD